MKLNTLSKSLALLLTLCLFLSLGASAFAMDFGAFAAAGIDPSFAAQSYTQQVELTLNGGTGDINTIIVQSSDGTPVVGESNVRQHEILDTNWGKINYNFGKIKNNAGTVSVNGNSDGSIQAEITRNNGTVETNYPHSIVKKNNGTVKENYGEVGNNNSGGTVTYNYAGGAMETNRGLVTTNWGTVQTNEQGGTVTYNHGTVTVNNGTVQSLVAGTVETNNGTINRIQQNGTVTLNGPEGIIQKNLGTVKENLGIVDNYADEYNTGVVALNKGTVFNYGGTILDNQGIELFQVTIERSANTSVTDAANGLTAHNGEAWKQEGNISGQATVTISPATGYSITNIAAAEGITPVQNADGSWTVTVDASLVNEGKFSLDTNVQKEGQNAWPPDNGGEYYRFSDNNEQYFAEILSLLNITLEPTAAATVYNAGPNAYDSFNSDRISELSAASENGTVTIDLRDTGWTTLKREVFEAAARRGDVTIVILYRQWGRDYTLTIPAGTDFSALSEAQFLEVTQLPGLLGLSAV